jgi:pimeloyl-ACP methyl ester carboxylesterase
VVTIIIPGYSSHNKEWLEETAKNIGGDSEIRPIYWAHWTDSDSKFDPKEKARLLDTISGKRTVDIIAKSLGTLAASYVIQKNPGKIRKIIFNGIPFNDLLESDREVIKSALKLIPPEDIVCFQNDEDPHGSFNQAKSFILSVDSKIELVSKPRNDHEYFYQDDFNKFLIG